MKKLFSIAAFIMLSGCDYQQPKQQEQNEEWAQLLSRSNGGLYYVYSWTDSSGCEYLIYDGPNGGNITPRLGEGGKPDCPKSKETNQGS